MNSRTNRLLTSLSAQLEKNSALAWAVSVLWVMAIATTIAWFRLDGIGLVDETEPLFAEAARQMTVTGDWITPYFNEVTRFDKPPLVYWLMASAYQTVGVNEWSARFPSALAVTVLAGMSFYVLYRFGVSRPAQIQQDEAAAQAAPTANPAAVTSLNLWLSALIGSAAIVLNPQTFLWSRTGVSDMLLSGCMGVALLAFFCGYAQPDRLQVQRRWYLAFYLFSALAVLTKGPVGVVLPGLIVLAFLLYLGQLRSVLQELPWLWGSLLFLLVSVPWFVLVIAINGESYINAFFGYHNLERFTSVVNNHWAPWYFYFPVVFLSFLPWSVHLPVAIARLRFWQVNQWRQQPRSTHLGLFALSWFAVIFGFFTIAVTKLPSYTLPLLPATGILAGLFWSEQMTRLRSGWGARVSHWLNIVIFAVLAGAAFYSPNWLGDDPEMPNLPSLMEQAGVPIWSALIWTIATVAGIILLIRRQGRWLWSVNLIGFMAFILVGLIPSAILIDSQRQLPLRELAETIVQAQPPNEPVVMVGFSKPSLVFYTQRPITYIPDPDEVIRNLRQIARDNRNADSLLLIGRSVKIAETDIAPEKYQTIDEAGVYQLVRISMTEVRAGLRAKS
ncbi:MAG: glycosyltransferase family 39 protein [Elainellaceae cyanobacterium]